MNKNQTIQGSAQSFVCLFTLLFACLLATSASAQTLFITEVADPNDAYGDRFVELYSPDGAGQTITDDLYLVRWTNGSANITVSSNISLKDKVIGTDGFLVFGKTGASYESQYDYTSSASVVDSNGDDNIALVTSPDPLTTTSFTIIDIFGVPGEDGTGTGHEFEDGRAERKASVTGPNSTWDVNEWDVDNDSGGGAGIQNAADMTPRSWIGLTSDPGNGDTISAPTDLVASRAASPNNQDTLSLSFTPDDTNSVLIVYSTVDTFGSPVDGTSYGVGDALIDGGTVAGVFTTSPAVVSGLIPGTSYYLKAYSVDSSTNYSAASQSIQASTATYALEVSGFDLWTANSVASSGNWSVSSTYANIGNYGADVAAEDWLISPELLLESTSDETFHFTYRSQYSDSITGLEVYYTDNYTGDPSTTTWTAFTDLNTELANYSSGSSVEASVALTGLSVSRVAFKYTSSGTSGGSTRNWYIDDPLISGNNTSDPAISLSAASSSYAENGSTTATLSVPSNVDADTVFYLSGNDSSEFSFPATVTILNGTNSIDFQLSGLTDGVTDGDVEVTLTAIAARHTSSSLSLTVTDIDSAVAAGPIIFTQYYEGTSNNKWIEITNIGDSIVNLDGYQLTTWRESASSGFTNSQAWKADGGTPNHTYDFIDVNLAPGECFTFADGSTSTPISNSLASATGDVSYFDGDDSIVLYSDPTGYLTANIVDAISMSVAEEGKNKGFVRTGAFVAYDLIEGSTIEDYDDDSNGVAFWTEITMDAADNATYGQDAYIGISSLKAAPPKVTFTDFSLSATEGDTTTIDLTVQILSPGGVSYSADIIFDSASSTAASSDIGNFTSQEVTFSDTAVSGDTQVVSITITDDAEEESSENAVFNISNLVSTDSSFTLGSAPTATVLINDNDTVYPEIFITEIADPNNSANSRYIELYSPDGAGQTIARDLYLIRWTNGNSDPSSDTAISLKDTQIGSDGFILIASQLSDAESQFNVSFDIDGGNQGPAASNGDDNIALINGNPSGAYTIIDLFGVPGEDGSGTGHEFEDGRAERKASVTTASSTWNADEWNIDNDGGAGNGTRNAPDDFDPGAWVGASGSSDGSGGTSSPYPLTEDFSGISTWVNQTVSGTLSWEIDSIDERAEADGYEGYSENHYLVSPAFDFTGVTGATISFNYGEANDGPDLELLYSTNYSGSGDPEAAGVTWSAVSFTFADSSTDGIFSSSSSGSVSLPSLLDGQSGVYLAFKYTADGADAEQWFIDDISVDAITDDSGSASDPVGDYLTARSLTNSDLGTDTNGNGFTVLEEYLFGFGDGSGTDSMAYAMDASNYAYTMISDLATLPEGISVELMATSDLTSAFQVVTHSHSVVDNSDGTFTHSYTETPAPTATERFYMLRISTSSSDTGSSDTGSGDSGSGDSGSGDSGSGDSGSGDSGSGDSGSGDSGSGDSGSGDSGSGDSGSGDSGSGDSGSGDTGTGTSGLFFSEYAEGSSNNKYLEIYNPTSEAVSLDGYALASVSNAPTTAGEHEFWRAFASGASIASGGVYIIAHPSADASITALADETHSYLSNGDDGYALVEGTETSYTIVDFLGDFQGDPGSAWDVAGVTGATKDKTLVRKDTITSGNSDWDASRGTSAEDSEWIVYDQNTWTYLGAHPGSVGSGD